LRSSLGSRLRQRLGSHLVVPGAAFLLAAAAFVGTGIRFTLQPSSPPPAHASLPPSPTSYLGVYETGTPPDYHPVAGFGKAAGVMPNMVGYYSGWAEPFAVKFAQRAHAHGAIPYVQIDPTLASVSKIATGAYDIYLRTYADSVRKFGHAVVIGFGHEMNAPWYSWGYGHVPPATFIAAWRHIVTLFHGQGADNVTWLWTLQADNLGTGPVRSWWPGTKYVTWVGIDGYYLRPSDTFARVFGPTIGQVRIFTDKPILLSETSVSPRAGQFAKINNLFAGMRQYKTLGLVWFDIAQRGGFRYQDWRIEGDAPAEAAFRLGTAALTLARPSR
jgi:Glycosyl hydrolase family 26